MQPGNAEDDAATLVAKYITHRIVFEIVERCGEFYIFLDSSSLYKCQNSRSKAFPPEKLEKRILDFLNGNGGNPFKKKIDAVNYLRSGIIPGIKDNYEDLSPDII